MTWVSALHLRSALPYGRACREPGRWPACWPLPPATGRRTADLPPLALPARLSTLETKLWPRLCLGSSARRGAPGNRRRGGRSWQRPRKLRRLRACEARGHACIGAGLRPTRHGGKAAPCRATPCADRPSTRPGAASFVLPSAFAPRSRSGHRRPGGAAAPAASSPANTPMAAGLRVRGKTPARWTVAPKAARSAVRMHPHCTCDDKATNSRTTCPMAR